MTAITWTGSAGDNNFDNAMNWSPQQVPTSADTVTIDPAVATSIGFSVGSNAVQSLSTNSFVTLNLSNQETFTIGTSAATTFTNGGTFALNSSNQNTDFVINAATVTLNGGGTIALDNNAANRIYGAAAGDVLNNVNNLIQGAGQLGIGQLTFINGASGTVNADQATTLVLNTGSNVVSNSGLLESTTGGGLVILNTVVNNGAGGHVSGAGGNVLLQGGTLQGGTLSSSGSGAIIVQGGQTGHLDGTTNTIVNTGSVDVQNQGTLTAIGTITNNGTIALQSSNQPTDFVIGAAGLTLNGTGTLEMSNNASNRIYGAAATDVLTNSTDLIQGAGQLGAGTLTFINSAGGTVDANLATTLVLNTGANVVTNNGLLESTTGGGLVIVGTTVNNGTHGLVSAAGGNVFLQGATLQGGTLSSTGAAAIVVQGSQTGTLDGTAHKVTNTGTVDVQNQGTLSVLNSIVNDSLIALQSGNQTTTMLLYSSTVTLTGAGTITMTDNGGNFIQGAAATDVLDNVNNLIEGSGHLGNASMGLINGAAGVIDASNASNRLFLNTGSNIASNSGLIEDTGNAGLQIQSAVNNGATGTVEANGASATVYLDGGTIAGGTLVTANGGLFRVEGGNTGTLDGSTNAVLNLGNFDLNNQATLTLLGLIENQGVITLGSSNQNTDLIIDTSTVTLNGGGTLSLSNNGGNRIYGAVATNVLDNFNNTITGGGQLGVAQLTLINGAAGIIDASTGDRADHQHLRRNGDQFRPDRSHRLGQPGGAKHHHRQQQRRHDPRLRRQRGAQRQHPRRRNDQFHRQQRDRHQRQPDRDTGRLGAHGHQPRQRGSGKPVHPLAARHHQQCRHHQPAQQQPGHRATDRAHRHDTRHGHADRGRRHHAIEQWRQRHRRFDRGRHADQFEQHHQRRRQPRHQHAATDPGQRRDHRRERHKLAGGANRRRCRHQQRPDGIDQHRRPGDRWHHDQQCERNCRRRRRQRISCNPAPSPAAS